MTQSPVLEDQWRMLFLFWGLGTTCFHHTAEFSLLRLTHPASPDSAPASSTWVTQCHIYVKAGLSDLCDSLVIPETGSYLLTYSLWLPSTPLGHSLSQCSHVQGHLMWGNNIANLGAPRITRLSESTPNPTPVSQIRTRVCPRPSLAQPIAEQGTGISSALATLHVSNLMIQRISPQAFPFWLWLLNWV